MLKFEVLLIFIAIITGSLCAFSDIRKNLVPNKLLAIGILAAFAVQIIYCSYYAANYFFHWLIVMLLSDFVAIMMYFSDMWAAGDAKLFCFLFMCVPCRFIAVNSLRDVVLPYILIFLPALVWLIFDSIYNFFRKRERFYKNFDVGGIIWQCLKLSVNSAGLYSLMAWLFPEFVRVNGLFCAVIIIFYLYISSRVSYLLSWQSLIFHVCLLLFLSGAGLAEFFANIVNNAVIVIAVILFQRWAGQYNYCTIDTLSVKSGMILSASSVLKFRTSRVKGLPEDCSEKMRARLTEQQAESVRRWAKSSQGQSSIVIVRKIPFAIFITLGFAAWLVFTARNLIS